MDDGLTDDERFPLRAAFEDYRPAPRELPIARPHAGHSVDDLRRLADGSEQVQMSHYEMTEQGVTKHTEWVGITRPLIKEEYR
ncbi:hypothetical protein C1S82_13010 [Mycolicibacterium cosmeticum]|nr:hypothetical protein C1S82_13010 [Mycolicibacterium cosmeticum]